MRDFSLQLVFFPREREKRFFSLHPPLHHLIFVWRFCARPFVSLVRSVVVRQFQPPFIHKQNEQRAFPGF